MISKILTISKKKRHETYDFEHIHNIVMIVAKYDNIKNKLLCSQDHPLKYEGQFQC